MMNRRNLLATSAAGLAMPSIARAQTNWPERPVRIVVPYPPGAFNDSLGRLVGDGMQAAVGQPGVVENRSGAGGTVGSQVVVQSPPDGHTILVCNSANLVFNTFIYPNLGYNTQRDLAPLGVSARLANVFVVNPAVVPATSMAEVIARAKARPGALNYASSGSGSSPHLAAELFKARAGIDIVHVPYRGSAPAVTDMLGGSVGMMFDNIPNVLQHIQAGRMRALAVTGTERDPALPDVPTMLEAGVPDYSMYVWFGFAATGATPAPIVARLATAIRGIVTAPAIQARIRQLGAEPWAQTPEEMKALMAREHEVWGPVIRNAGITA
ncbi:Bug family tripartite tricarboxylate transporter substrate binding protein [Falsiroseomonas sp. HC035]|uniref:Bug family tripartite tricarboxylate transporter substrate binding protein n=1 Tax=Falsiroseomonas sp. HC035 TaxID=3390999 RepID=UPI003D31A371